MSPNVLVPSPRHQVIAAALSVAALTAVLLLLVFVGTPSAGAAGGCGGG
jgi:hypothetical protein